MVSSASGGGAGRSAGGPSAPRGNEREQAEGRERRGGGGGPPRGGAGRATELVLQPGAPLGCRGRGRVAGVPGPPQRRERAVDPRRVVADVEPEGREPERFHFAAYRADEEIGGALAPRCDEPVLERAPVGDPLVCRPIRPRLGRGLAPFRACERGG